MSLHEGSLRRWLLRNSAPAIVALVLGFATIPATLVPTYAEETYVIEPGDTLSEIAAKLGMSIASLASLNDIDDHDIIYAGMRLRTSDVDGSADVNPFSLGESAAASESAGGGLIHLVAPGDTLSVIALTYRVSITAIAAANGISNHDVIYVGQSLVIPGDVNPFALDNDVSHESGPSSGSTEELPPPDLTPGPKIGLPSAEAATALDQAAAEFGFEPALLYGIAFIESGFQTHVVSPAGAIGLMQVLPETGDWAAEELVDGAYDWRTNPVSNARVGAAVLRQLVDLAGGDIRLALAAYYQGWGNIHEYGMLETTERYVEDVLAAASRF
ncbi:MAG TPA: LysM peptidoglycan-binding domain-containing protein [Dehalococcoidia bacterium]|nr:LysM peptidoglycan-binding domain-containing protein [Dehalococcoidia bacterium]